MIIHTAFLCHHPISVVPSALSRSQFPGHHNHLCPEWVGLRGAQCSRQGWGGDPYQVPGIGVGEIRDSVQRHCSWTSLYRGEHAREVGGGGGGCREVKLFSGVRIMVLMEG